MMTICNSVWLISGASLEKVADTPRLPFSAFLILPLKWKAGKMVKPTVHMGISTVLPGLPCPRDKCVATWPSCPGRAEHSPTAALEPLAQEMQNRRITVVSAAKKHHETHHLVDVAHHFDNIRQHVLLIGYDGFVSEILLAGALLLWFLFDL